MQEFSLEDLQSIIHTTLGSNDKMKINERTALSTSKVLLVPYSAHHVPRYHEWMKDPAIQEATASEPLSLDEEHQMQRSWRGDGDKLTFIVCQPRERSGDGEGHEKEKEKKEEEEEEAVVRGGEHDQDERMVGDVNMFLSLVDDNDSDFEPLSDSSPDLVQEIKEKEQRRQCLVGELELMIATTTHQRKGYGIAALLCFLYYVLRREEDIVSEFVYSQRSQKQLHGDTNLGVERIDYFTAKVSQSNHRSISLFQRLGFEPVDVDDKTGEGKPNYWGELEMRLPREKVFVEGLKEMLQNRGVKWWREVGYETEDKVWD